MDSLETERLRDARDAATKGGNEKREPVWVRAFLRTGSSYSKSVAVYVSLLKLYVPSASVTEPFTVMV
jgi:hypothetical protein